MPEKESQSEKDFPDWNNLYNTQNVKTMPWYNENLDSDLEEELERGKISKGRILDLGTGPATQAIQLAKRGLKVTGSDVSEAAIRRARELYVHDNKDKKINFTVDNILNSKLKDKMFDYVFDRGCFHVLPIVTKNGGNIYSPSSVPSTSLIVPLVANINIGPNVAPLSLLTLITGVLAVSFVSHHVITMFPPSASIMASTELVPVVLLRLVLLPNVVPPSIDALNMTSSFPFAVLLVHHTA